MDGVVRTEVARGPARLSSTDTGHQPLVDLLNESKGKRKLLHSFQAEPQPIDIVRDLSDIDPAFGLPRLSFLLE